MNKPSSFLPKHKTHTSWIIMEIFKNPILFPPPKMELEMLITLNKRHLERLKSITRLMENQKKWRFLKKMCPRYYKPQKLSIEAKIISLLGFWRSSDSDAQRSWPSQPKRGKSANLFSWNGWRIFDWSTLIARLYSNEKWWHYWTFQSCETSYKSANRLK